MTTRHPVLRTPGLIILCLLLTTAFTDCPISYYPSLTTYGIFDVTKEMCKQSLIIIHPIKILKVINILLLQKYKTRPLRMQS